MGYSVDYFVDFSVTTDLKNSSWRVLDLDQPGLGMSREYLIKGEDDEDVQVRRKRGENFPSPEIKTFPLGLLGVHDRRGLLPGRRSQYGEGRDARRPQVRDTAGQLFPAQVWSDPLRQIPSQRRPQTRFREERRNASKLYNPMRIRDLSRLDPYTPWLEYINRILTEDIIQVTEDEVIIVDVPSYLSKFSQYLQTVPARVQVRRRNLEVHHSELHVRLSPITCFGEWRRLP